MFVSEEADEIASGAYHAITEAWHNARTGHQEIKQVHVVPQFAHVCRPLEDRSEVQNFFENDLKIKAFWYICATVQTTKICNKQKMRESNTRND